MLIYARRETNDPVVESLLVPPPEALDIVQSMNGEYEKSCEDYNAKYVLSYPFSHALSSKISCVSRELLRQEFEQKRAIVMDIYHTWNISSTSEVRL